MVAVTRLRCSLEQLHRLHRDHPSRYPSRAGGRDAHCQDFLFFIASQSSRSVVAMTRSRYSLPKMSCFVASSSSRPVVAVWDLAFLRTVNTHNRCNFLRICRNTFNRHYISKKINFHSNLLSHSSTVIPHFISNSHNLSLSSNY
ncbi:hypothetical protein ACOSQ3_007933 [Xanthoceras sorbifolium]